MAKEIPVTCLWAFLESGKTKFIQETIEDPSLIPATRPCCWSAKRAKKSTTERFAFGGVTVDHWRTRRAEPAENLQQLEKNPAQAV